MSECLAPNLIPNNAMNRRSKTRAPDPRRVRLDEYRDQTRHIILSRQDPATGLLPASTAITVHGDYTHAWVRDNVYSILAVWALSLAYRREDPSQAEPLQASTVQLMRGLLAAMMKQAPKVERFKHTQHPLDALHAKYDTQTGEPVVGDSEWGHLQLDATAVFVLLLVRMSESGLAIVRTPEEVCFVQNLVYYLAKAHRTPDFGIWERGHKRNEGVAEINGSSLGMAKAALQAVDGYRFRPDAPAIHVLPDDIAHAREALEGLLPRESESKETDAALLSVVGFPAFAIDDPALEARTRAEIVDKLQGRYGCKRFLRDGHQTVLEDHSRLHYEPGELSQFEHIESEWPLFFTYLLLDAALRGDAEAAADYRARLDALRCERDGQLLLPELYFVPADRIDAERAEPHSQEREPNDNVPLVWAQSLYIVGVLLQEGFLDPADLRPPPAAAAGAHALQVVLLAEDELVRSRLASQGIDAQLMPASGPVQVRYAQDLKPLFAQLGRCESLGLSGRPDEDLGQLATCQAYAIGKSTVLALPSFYNRQGFYLTLDNRLLVDEIQAEAAYVRRHWRGSGLPVMALLVTEPMLDAAGADVLMAFLQSLAQGAGEGLRPMPLARAVEEAQRLPVDWIDRLPDEPVPVPTAAEVEAALSWDEAATRALTADRAATIARNSDEGALHDQLARSRNPYEQVEILGVLWQRHGPDHGLVAGGTVRTMTQAVYLRAGRQRHWGLLRRAAGLLGLVDESLEEAVGKIVVRQKRLYIGRSGGAEAVIARPLGNAEIAARLRAHGGSDPRARVLIQEFVLLLGTLVKAEPELFTGTLTLRPWHLVLLVNGWLAREHGLSPGDAFDYLLDLSPHALLGRLREAIAREQEMTHNLRSQQRLVHSGVAGALVAVEFPASADPVLGDAAGGWQAWRDATGVMTRVPEDFHARVWALLRHCRGVVIGDVLDSRNVLDSAVLRADTTPAELGFALRVDDLLNKLAEPAYRQLSIEALMAVSEVTRANDDLVIDGLLVVDVLLRTAVQLGWHEDDPAAAAAGEGEGPDAGAWWAFYANPPHRVARLVAEALQKLLEQAEVPAADDAESAPAAQPPADESTPPVPTVD